MQTVHANAGPPANIRLEVIHDGLDYEIDFLIEPLNPITEENRLNAEKRITEHELGFSFSLDYFNPSSFPRELIDFQSDQGFVSSTLYGSHDYAYFIPTQVAQNDQFVVYFRVPRIFQIALITEGKVFTSEVITMSQFDFDITWDIRGLDLEGPLENVGTLSELATHPLARGSTYLHFFLRLIVTLAVELLLLFIWGFRKKSTWVSVTGLNIITQSLLTVGTIYIYVITNPDSALLNAFFFFMLGELFVFSVEMFYLSFFVSEKSRFNRVSYSFIANVLSLIAGLFLMIALFN